MADFVKYHPGMRLKLRPNRRAIIGDLLLDHWTEWNRWWLLSQEVTLQMRFVAEKGNLWSVKSEPPLPRDVRLIERLGMGYWISLEDFEPVAPTRPRNHVCNCGSPAFKLFSTVECESPTCHWYKA